MDKTGLIRLTKLVRRSVLSFDLHITIAIGLALHWTWIWTGFWSSLFYSVSPRLSTDAANIVLLDPLWIISILTNILGYGIFFFACRKHQNLGRSFVFPLFAAIITLVGTLLISYPAATSFSETLATPYALGALLTGLGSALELILWAELLCILGARQTIVYVVLATIIGSAFYLIITFLPDQIARSLIVAVPAIEMWLYVRNQNTVRSARVLSAEFTNEATDTCRSYEQKRARPSLPNVSSSVRKTLLEIVGISLFFGLSYGVMKGFFVPSNEQLITMRDYLNIAALIIGAIAILVTTSVFRMDFRHMTYQIALPLMAAGFIFFSLDHPFDLIGFAIHQLGYQYFYIIIWALWAILARKFNVSGTRIACASMAAIMIGQLLGSFIGAELITNVPDKYSLAIIAAISVFIILLVALFAFEGPFPGSDWGLFHPSAQDDGRTKFKHSLKTLAEMRGLSPRETEVLELLAKGRNRSSISLQLVISDETTKTHIKRIYRKFGVHSQQALLDMIEFDGKSR